MYDVVIIGSGPAGLSAALYAKRAMLNALVIEKQPISGGQIINTDDVDNYIGLPKINGFDLAEKFREHTLSFGAEFLHGEVTNISAKGKIKVLTLNNGTKIETKTIIIATGTENRNLGVPGEEKFKGRGVSYCATCDGAFFRNKTVAVVGGGDVALEDAIYLARICKMVYLIHRRDEFRAARLLQSNLKKFDNITLLFDTVVTEIQGDAKAENIALKNVKSGDERNLKADGVFIAVGTLPKSQLVKGILELDSSGYIIADETGKTSEDGIFAAGDVRTKQLRQVVTATADGANCITSIEKYLL